MSSIMPMRALVLLSLGFSQSPDAVCVRPAAGPSEALPQAAAAAPDVPGEVAAGPALLLEGVAAAQPVPDPRSPDLPEGVAAARPLPGLLAAAAADPPEAVPSSTSAATLPSIPSVQVTMLSGAGLAVACEDGMRVRDLKQRILAHRQQELKTVCSSRTSSDENKNCNLQRLRLAQSEVWTFRPSDTRSRSTAAQASSSTDPRAHPAAQGRPSGPVEPLATTGPNPKTKFEEEDSSTPQSEFLDDDEEIQAVLCIICFFFFSRGVFAPASTR